MRRIAWTMAWVSLLCAGALPAVAQPQDRTQVRIVETWPPGTEVILGRNQNFYLRIAYDSAKPVRIWARPMFRGKPARAGSNPSQAYAGSGEALGWFFLDAPGAQVDAVQIRVGDGSTGDTRVLATWRGHVSRGGMASIAAEPDWVVRMNAAASDARDAAARQAASEPLPPIAGVFFGGFVLAFLAIGIVGVAAPAWAARRWHGGWRLAALAPGAYMAFVILRIAVGTALDPTSHNLWPFEILIAGALSAIAIGALGLARRFAGVGR